jgi:hypothetical protein
MLNSVPGAPSVTRSRMASSKVDLPVLFFPVIRFTRPNGPTFRFRKERNLVTFSVETGKDMLLQAERRDLDPFKHEEGAVRLQNQMYHPPTQPVIPSAGAFHQQMLALMNDFPGNMTLGKPDGC